MKVCMIFHLGLSTRDRLGFSRAEAKSQGWMASVAPAALSNGEVGFALNFKGVAIFHAKLRSVAAPEARVGHLG